MCVHSAKAAACLTFILAFGAPVAYVAWHTQAARHDESTDARESCHVHVRQLDRKGWCKCNYVSAFDLRFPGL